MESYEMHMLNAHKEKIKITEINIKRIQALDPEIKPHFSNTSVTRLNHTPSIRELNVVSNKVNIKNAATLTAINLPTQEEKKGTEDCEVPPTTVKLLLKAISKRNQQKFFSKLVTTKTGFFP